MQKIDGMGDVGVSSEVDEWILISTRCQLDFMQSKLISSIIQKSWAGVGPIKWWGVGCPARVLWYFSILMTSHRTLFMGYFERK